MVHSLIQLIRAAVRSGVFPHIRLYPSPKTQGYLRSAFHSTGYYLTSQRIWNDTMIHFPTESRECMHPLSKQSPLHHKNRITTDTVEKLRGLGCKICLRDQAFLALLYTTGLRIHAVANLRVSDVWDHLHGKVHQWFTVQEKQSKLRIIVRWLDYRSVDRID